MEDPLILSNVSVFVSMKTLRNLALSGLWSVIQTFIYSEHFFYRRVCARMSLLTKKPITWHSDGEWKRTEQLMSKPELRLSNLTTARMLLETGYDKKRVRYRDLENICAIGDEHILKLFLDRGWKKMKAYTVHIGLCAVANRGNIAMYALLIKRYPKITQSTISKSLAIAIEQGHANMIRYILNECNAHSLSYRVNKALSIACRDNHLEAIEVVLSDKSLDILGSISYHSSTPLMEACEQGHAEVVKLLLADERMNLTSTARSRAIMIASQNGYQDVVRLLSRQ